MKEHIATKRGESVRVFIYCIVSLMILASAAACGSNSSSNSSAQKNAIGIPQLTDSKSHSGWEREDCSLCHPSNQLDEIHSYNPALADSFKKVDADDIGACLYCHGTNGIKGVTAESYQCTLCHADPSVVASASLFGGHATMHDLDGDGKIGNSDCVICHQYTDMNGAVNFARDFRQSTETYTSATDFCLTCHDGNGAFGITPPVLAFDGDFTNIFDTFRGIAGQTLTADIHGAKDGLGQTFGQFRPGASYTSAMEIGCTQCHEVHTSDNSYLITRFGESAEDADADALDASVSVTGNNFTELCALCHMSPDGAITGNGLQEVVHPSGYDSNCTNCHYHGAGYGDKTNLF
ncbi:hypothetical protein EP073_03870 [Geovibrio thiophilus]|uniref:Uncharacterized protein n=1 Tax=Geovibrio thiophilus TaxID=139438 RepID=A0A3R5UU70_9BACT|nr:cytochrome c3 family protein [Geovibrio thiophilus]QAR32572.1 hypothetical protein EP073_03870 [Geovibrio thiophilus]